MTAPVARDHLRAFVERIERLHEERKALSDDIRDVYAEAKGNGFDVKALRTVIRLRAQDANERQEQEAIVETYLHALGMLGDGTADATRAGARETGGHPKTAPAKAALLPAAKVVSRTADLGEPRPPLSQQQWRATMGSQLAAETAHIRQMAGHLDRRGARR